jgi:hypothetical protein
MLYECDRDIPFNKMRNIRNLPSQEYLKEAIDYDPKTGAMLWKTRPVTHFIDGGHSAKHQCDSWNTRYAGKPAMRSLWEGCPYFCGGINGVSTTAHRVIWKWMTGEDALDVDHIDGDGHNNRFENLRSVSTSNNMKNMKRRADSKSGFAGVQWFPRTKKWRARIQRPDGREHHIGYFVDLNEAINARGLFELYFGGYLQEKRSA